MALSAEWEGAEEESIVKIKEAKRRAAYLAKYPVEPFFSAQAAAAAADCAEVHLFRRGEYVCEERMTPNRLYFLMDGRVKLSMIHQDGSVTLAQYFEAVTVLGELELLGIRSQSQTIQAVQDSVCIALPFERCRTLLLSDAVFLRNLSRFLAEKMLRSVDKLVATQSYPLENRLAAYLLETEEARGVGPGGWMKIRLTDLSQYLGCSYRHLSRVVGQFAGAGWIEKERVRLRITDRTALAEKVALMETE